MAIIHFYEKPGCINNSRQKKLLVEAGHVLIVHDLLSEAWQEKPDELRQFFGTKPVAQWFNRAAPRVKSGEIIPEQMDENTALALMLEEPLLIRRPLLQSGAFCVAGFDPDEIHAWLGLSTAGERDLETCPKPTHAHAGACSP